MNESIDLIIKNMIGVYGSTKEEVINYILTRYITENIDEIKKTKKFYYQLKDPAYEKIKDLFECVNESISLSFLREYLDITDSYFNTILLKFLQVNNEFKIDNDRIVRVKESEERNVD